MTDTASNTDRARIEALIPQRPPFLFVDRIVTLTDDVIETTWRANPEEPFFAGHYPGNPVLPGVIELECLAQSTALLLSHRIREEKRRLAPADVAPPEGVPVLTRVNQARFRRMVRPGDRLDITIRLTDHAANAYVVAATAKVGTDVAVRADLTVALVKPENA